MVCYSRNLHPRPFNLRTRTRNFLHPLCRIDPSHRSQADTAGGSGDVLENHQGILVRAHISYSNHRRSSSSRITQTNPDSSNSFDASFPLSFPSFRSKSTSFGSPTFGSYHLNPTYKITLSQPCEILFVPLPPHSTNPNPN